jgi:hypothetical protein
MPMGVLALAGWDWLWITVGGLSLALVIFRLFRPIAPVEELEEPKNKGFWSGVLDSILGMFLR